MNDFNQSLIIVCIFLGFIYSVFMSYKLKFKFKDKDNFRESAIDVDCYKNENKNED